MTARRAYTRHGLTATLVKVRLRGWAAIDRRTAAARAGIEFERELIASLGGESEVSPQRRQLVDMAVRAKLLLDHIDRWLFEQEWIVNKRNRSLAPVVVQRGVLADHLLRVLDKLGLDRVAAKVPSLTEYVKSN